jgi:iron complex outermembrane receptor protein
VSKTLRPHSCVSLHVAAILAAAAAALPTAALAQEKLEEVIVTAERRAVDIQKTPLSVVALSGADLDSSTIQSTIDLQYRTTGFVFKTNTVLGQPYIRGVGSDIISAAADASVATFVDDVYQTRATASIVEFYDLDRVELIKGPQSTLFGRNVTGGAVRLFSKRPQPEFQASGDLLYGNYDRVRLRGMVNVPLAGDKAIFRLSGISAQRDGYTENVFTGRELDDEDFWSARAQLLLAPNEDLELLLMADYTDEDSTRTLGNYPSTDCCVNLGILFGGVVPDDPRKVTHDVDDYVQAESSGGSAKITWDTGPITLTSITAYRKTEFQEALDLDATNVPAVSNSPQEESKTFTQDIQIASNGDERFDWIAGVFYLDEEAFQMLDIQLPIFSAYSQPAGDIDTEAWAIYGQGSYDLTDQWRVTLGLRYSHEERAQDFTQTISDPLGAVTGVPGTVVLANSDSDEWDSWTPKLGIEWFGSDDLMVYGSVAKGFKAGGLNSNALQPAFDPESLWAYEIGLKSTVWDGRARFNIAAFWYDYSDIQLLTLAPDAPTGAFPIVVNAAEATINGIEAELQAQITDGFSIDAAVTLLNAEYDEFVSIDPNRPTDDPDHEGDPLQQAPETSSNLGLQYDWEFGQGARLTARAEWRYVSEVFFNAFSDPVVRQGGYSLFNARLGYQAPDNRWYVALFGRNLGDKLYAQTRVRQDPLVGNLNVWGAPRTYGIEIGARL